jgi:LysM repeat protein
MSIRIFLLPALIVAVMLPSSVRAYDLPEAAAVSGVSGHPQSLSLDCEARSAADWAAFWGVTVDEITFLQQLPGTDNPETGFVGNVNDTPGNLPPRGYGVYAGPVAALLQGAYGIPAAAHSNLSEIELQSEIASGRPVIVWYIYGFRTVAAIPLTSSDGSVFQAAPFEHTGIVIGYDSSSYMVLDAFSGLAQRIDRAQFLNSWAVLGNMAIVGSGINLRPLVNSATAPAISSQEAYYTVQSGDTLRNIAARFGIGWIDLAAWNNLYAPYAIFPGQQLLVSGSGSAAPAQPITPPAVNTSADVPSSYTVQPGDTLAGIAAQFGLYWPDIAGANRIAWPYTIYSGQVLTLPAR